MKTKLKPIPITVLVVVLIVVAVFILNGRTGPSGFPLTIATVQKIDSGSVDFEEKRGKIIVIVTDQYGDSHIHILNHEGITKKEAITILKRKQDELSSKTSGNLEENRGQLFFLD